MIRSAKLLVAVLAALLMSAGARAADDVMVVFDGSNSMWGQIEGTAKIEIAREAMGKLLGDWTEDTNVGLMAYGHRREADCSDIETIIAPGPVDRQAFLAAVDEITPRGKTPLTSAIEQAAKGLAYRDHPATVVVISDGIESCDRDPCKLADFLEKSGVKFTAHVIGFGLGDEDKRSLACIADNTGGRFMTADNAGELDKALEEVGTAVSQEPAPADMEKRVEIRFNVPKGVPAGEEFEVGWSPQLAGNDLVRIVPVQSPDTTQGNSVETHGQASAMLKAPDGDGLYELRYVMGDTGEIVGRQPIYVQGPNVALSAPEEVKAGVRFSFSWDPTLNENDIITIVPADADPDRTGTSIRVRDDHSGEMTAPGLPGDYELRYLRDSDRSVAAAVAVKLTGARVAIDAPDSVVAGSRFDVSWDRTINGADLITIVPKGTDPNETGDNTKRVRDENTLEMLAPPEPGAYEVRYVLDKDRVTVGVKPITLTEPHVSLTSPEEVTAGTRFDVSWDNAVNPADIVTIVAAGTADGETGKMSKRVRDEESVELTAPPEPGRYEVRYVHDQGRHAIASSPLTITAASTEVSAPGTALMGSRFEVTWTKTLNETDLITVVPMGAAPDEVGNAERVRDKDSAMLLAPAKPGIYQVRYVLDYGRKPVAQVPIEITEPEVHISAPETVRAKGDIAVSWSGDIPNQADLVTVVPIGTEEGKSGKSTKRVRDEDGAVLQAPEKPGMYEVRYLLDEGRATLARAPVEVVDENAALSRGARLDVPETAHAGDTIDVKWTVDQPGEMQRISLARADQTDFTWIEAHKTGNEPPMRFKLPEAAGRYEVRFLDIANQRVLARAIIAVK